MSWITIDKDLCTECETCVTICGRGCFTATDDGVEARADETNCSRCGHCAAICPTAAIFHRQLDMDAFIDLDNADDIDTERFIRFLRKRRSHRHFQDQAVPWEKLNRLTDTCRYAPTGSNAQPVEILVVTDSEKIHRLSELAVDDFRQNLLKVEREISEWEATGAAMPPALSRAQSLIPMGSRIVSAWDAGRDPILRAAPTVMIFHSTPQASTPKDDCVIAAHTVTLTAMTMGLETCYIGLFEIAAGRSPALMAAMDLPPGNEVYSVLILGYPKYQFARTVARNPIRVVRM